MLPGGQLPCHRACQEGLQWRVRRAARLYSAEPGRMAGPERDREKGWNCQEGAESRGFMEKSRCQHDFHAHFLCL